MLFFPRAAVVAFVGCLVWSTPAFAQPPGFPGGPVGPTLQPRFSPYLNLARPNSNPAINYFGLVRPQNQFVNSIQNLQRQFGPFAPNSGVDIDPNQPIYTGNPFGFQTHFAFYQNQYTLGFGNYGAGRSLGLGGGAFGRLPSLTNSGGVPPPRRR